MSQSLVSIIVPIFNTEKYLKNCINSILNQSLEDIEVILVDDGSTDSSGKICDVFCKQSNKIKVIHKRNEGVSIARNIGIKAAKGEYIGFVDSDDYVNKDMYLNMYTKAKENNCDIVMCDCYVQYKDKVELDTIKLLSESMQLKNNEIYPKLLVDMAGSMCKCLYRKELLITNNILCPNEIKLSEDRIFNIFSFGYSKKIFYLKEALYIQKVRENSATTKYYDNMLELVLYARKNMFMALDKLWNKSDIYKAAYENQNINSICQCINNEYHRKCKKNIYEKYKAIKYIINNSGVREIVSNIDINNFKTYLIKRKSPLMLSIMAFVKCRK